MRACTHRDPAAAAIHDVDSNDPPDELLANFAWTVSTASIVKIDEVQGTTDTSPKVGQTVTVEGVVVGDFQGAGQFSGYYVQEEDADVDANPATSEGIFVFSSVAVNTGDIVRVTARVSEFNGLTELTPVSGGVSVRGTQRRRERHADTSSVSRSRTSATSSATRG